MTGKVIQIDKEKCDGCGLCVKACHEGALALVNGKAELVMKNHCDGLGDCLPACPRGAISFSSPESPSSGPGIADTADPSGFLMAEPSYQWPIQIALAPEHSRFYNGTIVIAADCTAFSFCGFRERFIGNSPVLIGCPKLDDRSRFDKVLKILMNNPIDKVSVIRMEVPCCRALTNIVNDAVKRSGRNIEVTETIISRSGTIMQ